MLFPGVTDWKTFLCAIIASIILWLSNLEGGKFYFNKYCLVLLVSEIAQTIQFLLAAKLVEQFPPLSVALGGVVVGFFLLVLYFIPYGKQLRLPNERADMLSYWKNDGASNAFWMMNTIISLFLYQEVGVTLTILLSMGVLIASFIASYFFYKDIPSRKDVMISILIIVCISLGTYFSPALHA